jgi:hypothetical protein
MEEGRGGKRRGQSERVRRERVRRGRARRGGARRGRARKEGRRRADGGQKEGASGRTHHEASMSPTGTFEGLRLCTARPKYQQTAEKVCSPS